MLGPSVSGLIGYGACRLVHQPSISPAAKGTIGEWTWEWLELPAEKHGNQKLGQMKFTKPGNEVTPPTRVLLGNAEGFALGYLTATDAV